MGKTDFAGMVQETAGPLCFPKACFIGKYLIFIHQMCYGKEVGDRDGVGIIAAQGAFFLLFHRSNVIPTVVTGKDNKEVSIG